MRPKITAQMAGKRLTGNWNRRICSSVGLRSSRPIASVKYEIWNDDDDPGTVGRCDLGNPFAGTTPRHARRQIAWKNGRRRQVIAAEKSARILVRNFTKGGTEGESVSIMGNLIRNK